MSGQRVAAAFGNRSIMMIAAPVIFLLIILSISVLRPHYKSTLEDGTFSNADHSDLTIKNGLVYYQGNTAPYGRWIGKGKIFLSPKRILGDLFVIEITDGKRVPADIVLEDIENPTTACSMRAASSPICFYKKK